MVKAATQKGINVIRKQTVVTISRPFNFENELSRHKQPFLDRFACGELPYLIASHFPHFHSSQSNGLHTSP